MSRHPLRKRSRLHLTVPGAYLALALALGLVVPELGWKLLPGALSQVDPSSAIAMLSAIASGMMALAGIAFSLAFVFFQLSSSAYTPRLLVELGRGQQAGHALGIFSGTFVYATLALRAVGMSGRPQLHAIVVWIALLWLLASAVALLLLTASLRQLSIGQVLADLGQHGLNELRRCYRPYQAVSTLASGAGELARGAGLPTQLLTHAGAPAYLVAVDERGLLAAARAAGGIVVVPYAIGDAVIPGDTLALTRDAARPVPEPLVREAIVLRRERTVDDHPEYALRLLVDIAIRALSPAVNDPSTAVAALDQIETLLRAFGNADLERGVLRDEHGRVRAVYMHPSWEDLLSLALTEIAQYGAGAVQIQRRLGALLEDLAARVPASRRAAVERLIARRERAIEQGKISSEAAGCDRQGLGHTL